MCGGLASGSPILARESLLRLALLMVLVEVVWGGLWSALTATDWATPLRRWQSWQRGSPVNLLPYMSLQGPASRLARTFGQLQSWWRELVRPNLGPTLAGLVLLLPLAVIMAGILGVRPLAATLVAITLSQLIFIWTGGDARPLPGLQALYEIALPWLAGHALFDPPTLSSVGVALAYAWSFAGGLRLRQGKPGLVRWNLGQAAVVVILVVLHQPLMAGFGGLLLLGQGIMQASLFDAETEEVDPRAARWFSRRAEAWLMAAMLVAAWGLKVAATGG
jgi:hypothetical protein